MKLNLLISELLGFTIIVPWAIWSYRHFARTRWPQKGLRR